MKTNTLRNLGLLLLIQIALIGAVWFADNTGDRRDGGKLLAFDSSRIDQVLITSAAGEVLIERNGGRWLLPGHHQLPVREGRIDGLLRTLAQLEAGWPVATTASAADRFEVADDNAQRKVALYAGDESVAELLLGTSPGFRKVHARRGDDDAVYAVEFALHEVPDTADAWFDKSLLAIPGAINAVRSAAFNILKTGDRWAMDGATEGAEVDQAAVEAWVNRFASLSVGNVPSSDSAPDKPLREFDIEADGSSYRLALFQDGEDYFVKGSQSPLLFALPAWQAQPILEADAASLRRDATGPGGADQPRGAEPAPEDG